MQQRLKNVALVFADLIAHDQSRGVGVPGPLAA